MKFDALKMMEEYCSEFDYPPSQMMDAWANMAVAQQLRRIADCLESKGQA